MGNVYSSERLTAVCYTARCRARPKRLDERVPPRGEFTFDVTKPITFEQFPMQSFYFIVVGFREGP